MEEEKLINTSAEPVTFEGTKRILDQMNKCVCKIYNKGEGTGFFTKIPFNSGLLTVLITSNHVLGQSEIKNNSIIELSLNYDKKKKIIKLDDDRKKYTNKELDITIIEIKENQDNLNNEFIELEDNSIDYFKDNSYKNENYLNYIYSNKSIYMLHYPKRNNIVVSYAQSPEINDSQINHKCNADHGSSGSPILLINNQKLIGVHSGSYEKNNYNIGTLIIYSIIEFQNLYNNNINREGNKINNYIIAEFETNEDNEEIRIFNSFEECRRFNGWMKDIKEEYNEKEIRDNCEIRINDKIIPFSYKYTFNKKGKHIIIYLFNKNITKINYLFFECKNLVKINLSNFNTKNVTNMNCMFCFCSSLTKLNLSNFNTQNVTNMNCMFCFCSSLTNLNLFSLNNLNYDDLGTFWLLYGCESLKKENIITNDKKLLNEIKKYFD